MTFADHRPHRAPRKRSRDWNLVTSDPRWDGSPLVEPWDSFTGEESPGSVIEITPDRLQGSDFPPTMTAEDRGGYLYCVAFDNEVCKVGYTTAPVKRISAHRAHSRHFGVEPILAWVSPPHGSFWLLEGEMIAHLKGVAEQVAPESFRGMHVVDAVREWWGAQVVLPPGETASQRRKRLGL